jgi:hypothetical protein
MMLQTLAGKPGRKFPAVAAYQPALSISVASSGYARFKTKPLPYALHALPWQR